MIKNRKSGIFFAVFVTLIIAFFFSCAGTDGGNGSEAARIGEESDEPMKEGYSLERFVNNLFNELNEEIKEQITQDFIRFVKSGYAKRYWMYNFAGITCNGWIVIGEYSEWDVVPDPLIINRTAYFVPLHNMFAWRYNANPEKNNFYPLQEACDLGFLSLDDLQGIVAGEFEYEHE